ncbi:LytTR family DNA-binding domain-containing protein [Flavobacteriaceae bacterium S356]|uniref:LytTR family DNA-binding domain-containing protein n=1 Tax=Asprobacillus argus TaxID=3076534 RepID=A0ABU3LFC8_9FLAO|nr:LytTR family DNA-binding domain-containing protein [Flavobacteriaceae bacterium S356]
MKTKCIVIDDEPLARKGLEDFITQTPFLMHVQSFSSAIEALTFLKEYSVDILFLDIQMPDMTGIELMQVLSDPPKVIFTTAHREFALDGFELDVADFLLKPFSYSRFLKAVYKTKESSPAAKNASREHVFIKCDGMIVKILIAEITYIETAKDYVKIHTVDNTYLTLVSLKQIEQELPKEQFIRVHRYYLVAFKHIDKLEGNLLYINNQRITISRTLRNDVYEAIIGNKLIER